MSSTMALVRKALLAILVILSSGILVVGRTNLVHASETFKGYAMANGDHDLVGVVFETFYLLARVLVGGYGGYALLRDIASTKRQETPRALVAKAAK